MPFKEVLAIKQRIVKDLKAEQRGRQATTPGPRILQVRYTNPVSNNTLNSKEIDENGYYAWATNNFKAETHYIVEGDKLYADLPDVMQSKGIQKMLKSRVNRVMIYDESPFPGLSPSASNDIFNASFKTLGSALETAISMELTEPQATAKSEPRKSQKPTDHEFTEEKVHVEQVTEKVLKCANSKNHSYTSLISGPDIPLRHGHGASYSTGIEKCR